MSNPLLEIWLSWCREAVCSIYRVALLYNLIFFPEIYCRRGKESLRGVWEMVQSVKG